MSNYFVRCSGSHLCKVSKERCHHVVIHPHDGDHSICFEEFCCPEINNQICICEPIPDGEIDISNLDELGVLK